MKFSIITPTHLKNSFLEELYSSLISQDYLNWEWILLLNGSALIEDIPFSIRNDKKVIIAKHEGENSNVGFVKNKAFHMGSGDILVEVDHDDILTPNCLSELSKAFADKSIGFVYSDTAILDHKKDFVPFNPNNGWKYDMFQWKDRELFSMKTFPATSHSLSFIWFAPDHVRAWRKEVYIEIGGHNPELSICDDHELMIRTYLHTEMFHIQEVLYIYRITGDNTWLERNAQIQEKTVDLFNKYFFQLAERDAQKNGKLVVRLDKMVDKTFHLLNYQDNSIGLLDCRHIIQKFPNPEQIMAEIHRVLCDGGWAFIEVPSTDGRGAWQDPTHKSFWNENSFWYYTKDKYREMIGNQNVKFVQFGVKTMWWDNNIAITRVALFADKENKNRPKLNT